MNWKFQFARGLLVLSMMASFLLACYALLPVVMIYKLHSEPSKTLEQLQSQGLTRDAAQRQLARQIDFGRGFTANVDIGYACLAFLPLTFIVFAWLLDRQAVNGRFQWGAMAMFILFTAVCLGDAFLAAWNGVSVNLHWLGE